MKKLSSILMLAMMFVAALSFTSCGGGDSDGGGSGGMLYDVLEVNNTKYACFGYKSWVTYSSKWNLSTHSGTLRMPCGLLSLAEKGEYDYCYMYEINLNGTKNLAKGSKLEDFSPNIEYVWQKTNYASGSATVIDITDRYITIRYDSFKFGSGSGSYTLNGTVQLDLEYEGVDSGGGSQGEETSSDNLKIIIDGNPHEFNFYYNKLGRWSTINKDYNLLAIGTYSLSDINFKYPKSFTYSNFTSGYSNFVRDATSISFGISGNRCTYVSGSAIVLSNDGSEIKIRFSNFKLKWGTSREIIFDGIMRVEIE